MEKKPTSHLTKGLIISLITIVISTVAYFMGQQNSGWVQFAQTAVLLGGIIWACITYGRERNNQVTFGNVFGHGFKVTAVITCITLVFTILFMLIFPEMKAQALENSRLEMEKNPKFDESSIEQGIAMVDRMFYIFLIGGIILMYLIIGAVASLIGAAVTKKTPVTPFENQI